MGRTSRKIFFGSSSISPLQFRFSVITLNEVRFAFLLAVRYFRVPRKSVLARLTRFAAFVGIAFGTAAMIFAIGLANGFQAAMSEKILANTAHITILRADGGEIRNPQELSEEIREIESVAKISPQSVDNALLIGKTNSAFAVLRGSGEKSEISNPKSQTKDKITIEIGAILAEKVGLKTGDAAEIVSGSGEISESFAPISTLVEVGGVFETGLYEYDSTWIKISLADARRLTGKTAQAVSFVAVETADIYRSDETARKISEKLSAEFQTLDWREANRPLFAALALERRIAFLIVSLIVFVAVLNIATTLALSVGERRFDIAVLRVCGASGAKISAIFLLEGLMLAALGLTAGVLLGVSICLLVNHFDLISLPADVYEIARVRARISLTEILLIAAMVLILSVLASLIPARAAANQKPLENVRS